MYFKKHGYNRRTEYDDKMSAAQIRRRKKEGAAGNCCGHMGIGDNEVADRAAKEAAGGRSTLISIPARDYQDAMKKIEEKWKEEWINSGNKMTAVKQNVCKWKPAIKLSRTS